MHLVLVMYYCTVLCFCFNGHIQNKLESLPPKTNDWQALGVSQASKQVRNRLPL